MPQPASSSSSIATPRRRLHRPVLLIVGIMLISEGGHISHLKLFGYAVEPMAKSTFYFVIVVMLLVDIVQGRYQKQLLAKKKREIDDATITTASIDAKIQTEAGT